MPGVKPMRFIEVGCSVYAADEAFSPRREVSATMDELIAACDGRGASVEHHDAADVSRRAARLREEREANARAIAWAELHPGRDVVKLSGFSGRLRARS